MALDPNKRYYISVSPGRNNVNAAGQPAYQLGGAQIAKGQASVTVKMIKGLLPTAQISVFIFRDQQPLNGAPDLPQELGLGGFSLMLVEAGGTYGASGGQVTMNAFGDPIGTEYQFTTDPISGKQVPVLGPDGITPVVAKMGKGYITTSNSPDDLGVGRFKYLVPGKYTVFAIPPGGADPTAKDTRWHQTSTIEGTKGIDAWVKANEPSYFAEFGPPGHHVFIGFVEDTNLLDQSAPQSVTGRIVNMHTARPPEYAFYNGAPVDSCRVGLNQVPGDSRTLYTTVCKDDGTFTIPHVTPGTYQLVVWDDPLNRIIALKTITVPNNGANLNLLDVPVFSWFHQEISRVFYDTNGNGFRDPGEVPIAGQNVNIRFRDGSIYQAAPTDPNGEAIFKEVFPFFNWMVMEVDFARLKATGVTTVVDGGGPVPAHNGWTTPSWDVLNPQLQKDIGNAKYRTEIGPYLTKGMQGFLGTTNVIEWGKSTYPTGKNGGVSGMVQYGITRAESDPRYAAAENWEPGIPGVQVNLYRDCNGDGTIDQPNAATATNPFPAGCLSLGVKGSSLLQYADVDNYPFGWQDGTAPKGPEDVEHGTIDGVYSKGWAIDTTHTDSWDANQPSGCQGDTFVSNGTETDCYDGLRNFNQVRDAVYDGGFAFGSLVGYDLQPGTYIVEANTPPGYELLKEEDKNVDFGDSHTPSALQLPPPCVGDLHLVPDELTLFAGVPGEYAGQNRPLCDRKQVRVADGLNAAANFFLFTETPVAGHIVGMILDDTANEFDPNAPTFGERHAPSWVPVSLRDWTGKEIARVYSDQWGTYNALVPSTFTLNPAFPSGVGPNMITACMNHAGPIIDQRPGSPTLGQSIIDPYFNRQYSQFCYTFQYLPGKTTYLDTPVVPVAAFSGPGQFPLDCEFDAGTPVIYSVQGTNALGGSHGGPYVPVPVAGDEPLLKIISSGETVVSNPAYDGTTATSPTITRDFGFGADVGSVTLNGQPLEVVGQWSNDMIIVRVPVGASTGQLAVTRSNGKKTVDGVTVTVGGPTPIIVSPGGSIQAAVNSAVKGDLILVAPGTYDERVILNKQVRVQGWGAPSTIINIAQAPAEKLAEWRNLVNSMYQADTWDMVPGQDRGVNLPNNEPNLFVTEEGAVFTVVAKSTGPAAFDNFLNARIDGFTISGADSGGGIFVNGYAKYLEISNNRIVGNSGTYGGGIRFGHTSLTPANFDATDVRGGYSDNGNDFVNVHNNHVTQNGSLTVGGAGGGITLAAGSDNYKVSGNYVCGNYSMGGGGGIGHIGHSANGLIDGNTVLFNQSFNQGIDVHGGGILVTGQASRVAVPVGAAPGVSAGTGSVAIVDNLVQGNQAGAGDGGGIGLMFVNGLDVKAAPNNPAAWYQVTLKNNKIVNNVSGHAGAVALQDVLVAEISNNTIANNDSTATTGSSFAPGSPNQSMPQSAGLVSFANSASLIATGGNVGRYSNPTLDSNILWHNRTFYWAIDNSFSPARFGLVPNVAAGEAPVFSDLAVLGTANQGTWPQFSDTADKLNPTNSTMTNMSGYDVSNSSLDPAFVAQYYNGGRSETIILAGGLPSNMGATAAFDEGGNFIDVRYGPLTRNTLCGMEPCPPFGDYRLPDPLLAVGVNFSGTAPADTIAAPRVADPAPGPVLAESTAVFVQCPGDTNGDAVIDVVDNTRNLKCMHLGAGDGFINMPDKKRLYTFGYSDLTGTLPENAISAGTLAATFPAPTIELKEGQEFFLTLTNVGMVMRPDLFDPHTVHFHGYGNAAPIFDGMPEGSIAVNMGTSQTYYYNINEPGTYMYHCHVEAAEHMQMGMLGNLYVTPKQDGTLMTYKGSTYDKFVYNDTDGSTGYNKSYALQLGSMDSAYHDLHEAVQPLPFAFMKDNYSMINGRGYPDTVVDGALPAPTMDDGSAGVQSQLLSSKMTLDRATEGTKLMLRLSNLSITNFYTVTILGLPMRVVGAGAAIARGPKTSNGGQGKDLYYQTSTVTLGGGEANEVIIDTAGVPAGTYFLYTTNLNYLSNNAEDFGGMMTEIVIK